MTEKIKEEILQHMIELNIPRQMDDTKATGMVIQAPFTTDEAVK